jgi:membrane protease subunit HflC
VSTLRRRPWKRLLLAAGLALIALGAASAVPVRSGDALVVTRLGKPVRVVCEPGLAWVLPAPLERARRVNRRLRTTGTGSHGVLTKDGLSLVVQAYAAWRIPGDAPTVLRFVRATAGDGDAAANQLRTLLNSALETVSGRYAIADLVNVDGAAVHLHDYERALLERVESAAGPTLGIEVVQVGVERLLLPEVTLQATVLRMAEERRVAAEERQAAGRRTASEITANADKDARIAKAGAEQEAAAIEAKAKAAAAAIYGAAYSADPDLYVWLRSLDALQATLAGNAHLVLSTDSPPFRALVSAPPPVADPAPAPAPPPAAPAAPSPGPSAAANSASAAAGPR